MNANILIYISLAASGIALGLGIFAVFTSSKSRTLKRFFSNKDTYPDDLQDMIDQIVEKIEELDSQSNQTIKNLQEISTQLNTAVQNVGIIRYNGNGDDGGNLSFSIALLNSHQSGLILTSLHGRQQNRIYTKVVNKGESESTLSEEEKEALIQALTNKHN